MADQRGIDVVDLTRPYVVCTHCWGRTQLPENVVIQDVYVEGAQRNVVIHCGWCGRLVDVVEPGDGLITTTAGGQLTLIRKVRAAAHAVLADRPTQAELVALVEALESARASGETVEDAVARVAAFPQLEAWVRANPTAAKMIGTLLVIILTALATRIATPSPDPAGPVPVEVHINQPSEGELQRLIDEAVDRATRPAPSPPETSTP